MKNDNFIDFGEEISRTVRKVLTGQDFYDLKHMINRTMRNVPGMGGGPFYEGPFNDGSFPKLSRDEEEMAKRYQRYDVPENRPRRKRAKGGSLVPGTLLLVFGFTGTASFGMLSLGVLAAAASFSNMMTAAAATLLFGIPFLISLIVIPFGFQLRNRAKRFRLYQKVLDGRTYCTVKELSAASRRDPRFIIKDLRKMIRAGLFAEGYLDEQETCLMTDYKTYSQYLDTVKYAREREEAEKLEKEKWASREGGSALKETIDEGKNYIRAIKAANDALPEEEISDKLDQLEQVTSKIFNYVEEHPEKLPEIRKFMSYYMPITLKLVNAYQRFEQHGVGASEVEATKLEIRGTLDTINKAYQNLLKKLMQADILDVSSDISALETILAQEGLTEDGFTGPDR
jgi:5-bromo-4-chloroindolyl phosphate hydrolysis protein